MNANLAEPEILHYSNYRTYLLDFYDFKKIQQPSFSHRFFMQKAGIASPNYLKLVMDGKRNLTKKTLVKFQLALGLKGKRAEFFENLVFFTQANSLAERNLFYGNILKVRAKSGLQKLAEAEFQLFSDWRHMVVRELAAVKGFRADPKWIAKKIGSGVTEKDAEASLNLLSALGLLKKTANGYSQSHTNITTSDEVRSLYVKNHHRQMMQLAMSAMERFPAARRDISSITIPIHARDLIRVKEHIQLMRKELLNMAADPGEGEDIVQVNIQLFPLTDLSG